MNNTLMGSVGVVTTSTVECTVGSVVTWFKDESKSLSCDLSLITYKSNPLWTNKYILYFNENYNEEREVWNRKITNLSSDCMNRDVSDILKSIYDIDRDLFCDDSIFESANDAFSRYINDSNLNSKKIFPDPSVKSFFQLIRFFPELKDLQYSVYIDEVSGFFGLMLKTSKYSKPILNLLMKDNNEIIFSFIKKGKGMIKITGRAFLNDNLEDSGEINNLLRMLK